MNIDFDLNGTRVLTDDYWNFSIGSCHAATALRQDYRAMLSELRRELGFRYLRFHGLFDDDMCVVRKSLYGDYVLSFLNVDSIFDFLLSIGMKPFIEIGFMPDCLKSGNETIFHYKANVTPPKDEALWSWLIEQFVLHLTERYGRAEVRGWFFEIWNEPNLGKESGFQGGRFFSGTMDDYFKLYTATARAIKSVDPAYRVGGPATSNNAWIPQFLDYAAQTGSPVDFVTTHHYPTDVVLGYGVEDSENFVAAFNGVSDGDKSGKMKVLKEYLTFSETIWKKVDRGVVTEMARRAKSECRGLPLYYTEWSSLAGIATDGAFGASFIAKTVEDNAGLVEGYSYWTFSDLVEEVGMPNREFHGGFGLMTVNGVKKAPYNAFKLLSKLGETRYEAVSRSATLDVYAHRSEQNKTVQILAVNHQSLDHPVESESVTIEFHGAELFCEASVERVDAEHANPLSRWEALGCPAYPAPAQLFELRAAAEILREPLPFDGKTLRFDVPAQGVALITLYLIP